MLTYKLIQLFHPLIPTFDFASAIAFSKSDYSYGTKVEIHFNLLNSAAPSFWPRLPCRARWLLHKPTVTQAHYMLCETPATPSADMTELRNLNLI